MPADNKLENILISCLEETMNVMICCESTLSLGAVNAALCRYSTFNVFRARSLETMETYLKQVVSWNCFIIDSRSTFARDAVIHAASLPSWVPVVVIGDSPDSLPFMRAEGEKALPHLDCIEYCSVSDMPGFVRSIQELGLKKKLMSFFPTGMVGDAADILFSHHPLTVDEWACAVESSPRKFQPVTELSPKKILAIYHAYRIAFDTIERRSEPANSTAVSTAYSIDEHTRNRVMEYVLSRRTELALV